MSNSTAEPTTPKIFQGEANAWVWDKKRYGWQSLFTDEFIKACQCGCGQKIPDLKGKHSKFVDKAHKNEYWKKKRSAGEGYKRVRCSYCEGYNGNHKYWCEHAS